MYETEYMCLSGGVPLSGDDTTTDEEILDNSLNIYSGAEDNTLYNAIVLYQGCYDTLYICSDTSTTEIPANWELSTILWAKFYNNLAAGQTEFALSDVAYFVIERKEKNDLSYSVINVLYADAFKNSTSVSLIDRFVQCFKEYEYLAVPVLYDGTESTSLEALYSNDKQLDWYGYYIYDGESEYHCELGSMQINYTRSRPSTVQNTMNGDYPYVISNTENNYDTITVSATDLKEDCSQEGGFDLEGSGEYRQLYDDFLTNGKPKLFRDEMGRIRICALSNDISHNKNSHRFNVDTGFTLVEVGNALDPQDLYDYNFSDYNPSTMIANNIAANQVLGVTLKLTVIGTVSGDVIEGVSVTILRNDISIFSSETDANGLFVLAGLESGVYCVSVNNGIYTKKKMISVSSGTVELTMEIGGV